jgi:hypothetical protein
MPDWTHTLEARQAGMLPGFLDVNTPLEDQDEAEGGVNVTPAAPEPAPEPDPAPTPEQTEGMAMAEPHKAGAKTQKAG